MIGFLRGSFLFAEGNRVVIDVRDVGYEVLSTLSTVEIWRSTEQPLEVYVHTHVREEALSLYGFASADERRAFVILIGVSGVGPKLALAALDDLGAEVLAQAIEAEDHKTLCRISGVGKRTAQRLVLELKGKLPISFSPDPSVATPVSQPVGPDNLALALTRLGYSRAEIERAKAALLRDGVLESAPIADRLRAALKALYGKA